MNKIKFLVTFCLIFCSLLASILIGLLHLYKNYDAFQKESSEKLLYFTEQKASDFENTLLLSEKSVNILTNVTEKTIDSRKFNSLKDNFHRYDEYHIPYLSNYIKTQINPIVAQIVQENPSSRTAYLSFIPEAFEHKTMICSWGMKDINDKVKFISCGKNLDPHKGYKAPQLEWIYGPLKTGKGYWTKLYVDEDLHIPMISYAEPVYVDNKIVAVAGIDLSLSDIQKKIESFKMYKTGTASILDKDYKVIFSKKYKPHEDLSKLLDFSGLDNYTRSGTTFDKSKKVFISYAYLPNNFIFVVEVPEKEILKTINDVKGQLLLVSIFIFIFSIGISMKIGAFITEPFEKLNEISQKLIEMDFSIKIDDDYKIAEIKSFADALKQFIKVSRENQKNKELIDSIVDSLIDALVVINEKGIIFSANPSINAIFGYTKRELIGKSVDKLFKEKFFEGKGNYNYVYNKLELSCIKKDGTAFPAEVGINEIMIGNKTCYTILIRDITYHRQVDRMKNEFVSTVSHELRTPLTSIMGVLGLLLNIDFSQNPEKSKELLQIANNNSIRLLNLVNDILDMQKIEAGKVDFALNKINLNEVVKNLLALNNSYADKYNVLLKFSVNTEEDVFIKADKDRLSQSITNLLSNAIKFSPINEIVEVSLEKIGNIVRLSITDKGKGIPEESRPKIFKKFSQIDSTNTRSKDGTGLGLYITKYLIENMGGKIDFESELDKGTRFFIDFPILNISE